MNIRENLANYLFDKKNCICAYDDYVYVYKYRLLKSFNDKRIQIELEDKKISVIGKNLIIIKITKEEILIKGSIESVEVNHE